MPSRASSRGSCERRRCLRARRLMVAAARATRRSPTLPSSSLGNFAALPDRVGAPSYRTAFDTTNSLARR
jgi:hypothetical protein